MIGLFDRDVFLKLGCCSLWSEAVEALSITSPYRLASTSSAKWNARHLSRMLGDGDHTLVLERVTTIASYVPTLPDDLITGIPASEGYRLLGGIDGIDAGEQLLAAILMRKPEGRVLISGDKRFILALREQLPLQWLALQRQLISFEMCMLAIEERFGFTYLLERVFDVRRCDGSLYHSIGLNPTRENFLAGMRSFNPCR